MKTDMQNKIDKTMQSTEGMSRAEANPFLFGKIMSRMQARKTEVVYTGKVVLRYATLVLILAGINVLTVYKARKGPSQQAKDNMAMDQLADEYFINSKVFEY